jgi:hypothetical protein
MKQVYFIVFLLILASCSHKHGTQTHHHHEDENSISPADHGGGRFTATHRGETYYFDTEKEFLNFEEKLRLDKKRTKCVRRGRNLTCGE